MKKAILFALLTVCAAGCGLKPDASLGIKNSCKGVWVRVVDSDEKKLVDRLEPGDTTSRDMEEYQGRTVRLVAYGYEVGTNREMGTTQTSRDISRGQSFYMEPSKIPSWEINDLFSRENGGCKP